MTRRKKLCMAFLVVSSCAAAGVLYGQAVSSSRNRMPDEMKLQQEIEKAEQKRKEVFSDPSLEVKAGSAYVPQIEVSAQPAADPLRIAKSYEQEAVNRTTETLMIFASFSLPKTTLKALVDQAHKAGGVVVLRGFKEDDLKTTVKAINELGSALGAVQINPKAFTQYQITQVPTFVLVKAGAEENLDEEGCVFPEHYAKVSGDVTVSYAMEQVEKRSKAFSSMAARYRRMLGG